MLPVTVDRRPARRVLVLRPDNLGDVILFSGALRHLRQRFPSAGITLCVRESVVPLVALSPYVDRIVSWEQLTSPLRGRFGGIRGRGVIDRAIASRSRRSLRFDRDDVVSLPVRSPTKRMHDVVRAFGCERSFGITGDFSNIAAADDAAAASSYVSRLALNAGDARRHDIDVTCEFLRLIGVDVAPRNMWPEFWTTAGDRRWAERNLPAKRDALRVAVCPGVSAPIAKLYSPEMYGPIFGEFERRSDSSARGSPISVALLGSPSDGEICAAVEASLRAAAPSTRVDNLCGASSVREFVEALRACDAVLSADSAASHIAVALRKPSVVILGGGHFGRFHPWGDPGLNRTAHQAMDCFGCNWTCRYETIRCIQELSPNRIAGELFAALSETKERPLYEAASAPAHV